MAPIEEGTVAEVHLRTCFECGIARADTGTHQIYDTERELCPACFRNYYGTCWSCSHVYRNVDMCRPCDRDRLYCNECVGENCSWCEECEEYYFDGHEHETVRNDCLCVAPHPEFTLEIIGNGLLDNDQVYSLVTAQGQISDEALVDISSLLARHIGIWTQKDWHIWVTAVDPIWANKQGNFTKRLSRHLYQMNSQKIPPETLALVGNIAQQHSEKEQIRNLAFTRDLNKPREEFMNDGSCWWTEYASSRCYFKASGGMALRFFRRSPRHPLIEWNPTARCWVQPLDLNLQPTQHVNATSYVVFNPYGASGVECARIMAQLTGLTYKRVNLYAHPLYINNTTGWLCSSEPVCDGTETLELRMSPCKGDTK